MSEQSYNVKVGNKGFVTCRVSHDGSSGAILAMHYVARALGLPHPLKTVSIVPLDQTRKRRWESTAGKILLIAFEETCGTASPTIETKAQQDMDAIERAMKELWSEENA